jgi:two-component system, LytTR family, response regulator
VKVLIVDDEAPARALIRELLSAHDDVEIVGEAKDGLEAVRQARDLKPDLIFLDVEMPKLSGIEALELIEPAAAVIFVTAYDEYAVKAFEVNAVDYLLKPLSASRFADALTRARGRFGTTGSTAATEIARAIRPPGTFLNRIVVRDGARVELVAVGDLDYVKGQADYIELFVASRSLLKQQTLQSLEESLDPQRFVRIHRSYIVNLSRVRWVEPYTESSKVVVLEGGRKLPLSRAGETRLKAIFGDR